MNMFEELLKELSDLGCDIYWSYKPNYNAILLRVDCYSLGHYVCKWITFQDFQCALCTQSMFETLVIQCLVEIKKEIEKLRRI